jgi:hypothetical protein
MTQVELYDSLLMWTVPGRKRSISAEGWLIRRMLLRIFYIGSYVFLFAAETRGIPASSEGKIAFNIKVAIALS